MAVLNRSQLRGVGIVLPSLRDESPEVDQLKNNLLTRRDCREYVDYFEFIRAIFEKRAKFSPPTL